MAKYDLNNRVAIVTGSSSGIGAEIALKLAANGALVVITGRNGDALALVAERIKVAAPGGAEPLQVVGSLLDDAFPWQLVQAAVAHFGAIDILVNNAGAATPYGGFDQANMLTEYDQVMRLNVRSVVEMTQLALPYLAKSTFGGNVLNISSIAGIKAVSQSSTEDEAEKSSSLKRQLFTRSDGQVFGVQCQQGSPGYGHQNQVMLEVD